MIQGLRNLSRVDLGYSPEGLLTVSLTPPAGKAYSDPASQSVIDRLQEAARSTPGAISAAFAMPFSIGGNGMLAPTVIPGRANPSTPPFEPAMYVSPSFFETMRIPLRAGRTFSREEHDEVVVNEEFVRRFLPDENPLGRQIRLWSSMVIVGVVGNSHIQGTLTEVKPEIYINGVNVAWSPTLLVRTTGPASGAAGVLQQRIKETEPGIRIGAIKTLEASETARTVVERFTRLVLAIFAALATVLACLGIYGVASFSVAQRTHEIGIRIALGASRSDVAGLVFRQTLWAALAGTVAGAAGVTALSRLIQSFLYNVHAYDPATVAGVVITLALVATLASAAPILRASRVDPAISLRHD
jgi:putative ABC transport system permease protein